ncbi:unnamed protein product [Phytophthora lilii]|uniref:Unnamed protein product n=1 Tax=Phytophthora lilii TaxID=2077276 RepID=A0A9W6U327_9STRA|nr:unnamed protein product [Phytophthora lilii]
MGWMEEQRRREEKGMRLGFKDANLQRLRDAAGDQHRLVLLVLAVLLVGGLVQQVIQVRHVVKLQQQQRRKVSTRAGQLQLKLQRTSSLMNQPPVMASSFTRFGLSARSCKRQLATHLPVVCQPLQRTSFTAVTVPAAGVYTSLAALTDSTAPNESLRWHTPPQSR